MTELLEEGLLVRKEVEQMWEGLPKAANRVTAAGVPGTNKGTLVDLQGFLEFDRQVHHNICAGCCGVLGGRRTETFVFFCFCFYFESFTFVLKFVDWFFSPGR